VIITYTGETLIVIEFNINSPYHMSCLIYGGTLTVKEKKPIIKDGQFILFKSGVNKGSIKYRLEEKQYQIKGLGIIPNEKWRTKNIGVYQTNEDVLSQLKDDTGLINTLLDMKMIIKQLSTYYDVDSVYDIDECIRGQFNHCTTKTGRLSSSNPNLQNIPREDNSCIKEHFVSRF
jgi:DNA polymerase family A